MRDNEKPDREAVRVLNLQGVRAECQTGEPMSKKRILFVDDRPEHLRQPVVRLQLAGYEVDDAASGTAALQRLRERDYHLLILDAELPDEDGWDVLRSVRKDDSLQDLKVIVFMAGKGETGMLVLIPVDAVLRRPFTMGALLDAVRKVIGPP
jgi:two-component system, OmpR family, KDP operon response regulator KdpE